MYDALLSVRGWGPEHFRLVTPDGLAAARWALYAEKAGPMVLEQERIAGMEIPKHDAAAATAVVNARLDASRWATLMRPIVFPEDDDG